MNRIKKIVLSALICLFVPVLPNASATGHLKKPDSRQPTHDGQHDFDFETGTWKTHLKRLQHPLSGSTTWLEYDGTSLVRKVWSGKANLVELEADGPAGHIEALSLRLYNPESKQWSLNFASGSTGALGQPSIGEFKGARGEFYDQENYNGRAILLRFIITPVSQDVCRLEQSFSDDGGKTWELNWIATDTRVKDEKKVAGGAPMGMLLFPKEPGMKKLL
jgi:hypothetical protein